MARTLNERLPLSVIKSVVDTYYTAQKRKDTHRSADELVEVVKEELQKWPYDGVAHIRVTSSRDVEIGLEEVKRHTIHDRVHVEQSWLRSQIEVVTVYRGTLPHEFEMVNEVPTQNPNFSLDVGQEYILFVWKRWLLEGEVDDEMRRYHYSGDRLAALGGEGYGYHPEQAWILDGDKARLAPGELIDAIIAQRSHLQGARDGGEHMPLETLIQIVSEEPPG